MKVLVFTTVFPNAAQPTHGLFVFERLRYLARHAEVQVLAPVSWRVWLASQVPYVETRGALQVVHPVFYYVPGILKVFDGVLLFCSSLIAAARLRRTFAFDLIDAHFTFPDGFAAVLLGWWFRCPVVVTVRGTILQLSAYRLRRRAIGFTLRRANRVITVSQPLADHAIALGADRSRVEVIPNGVDVSKYAPIPRDEARVQLGLPPGRRLIVSVGHLSARKGFQRVLAVLPTLLSEFTDLVFAVVGGPGAERDNTLDLRQRASAATLRDHVMFAGPQPPEVVRLWLNAADVFVLASDLEGCPNVVWEALACGRPVVATRVGEIPRMVPSFAGLLFDDADDLQGLETCLRTALNTTWNTDAIRAYACQHTWERVARRVLGPWRAAQVTIATPNARLKPGHVRQQ